MTRKTISGIGASEARGAFTLIEMIVVIAIIAILVAILVPSVAHIKRQGRQSATEAHVRLLRDGIQQYFDFYDRWPGQTTSDFPGLFSNPVAGGLWSNDNHNIIAYLLPDHDARVNPRRKAFYGKGGRSDDAWGIPYIIQITNNEVYVWSENMKDKGKFKP